MIVVAVALMSAGCSSSVAVGEPPSSDSVRGAAAASTQATQCRDDGSFRARLVETDAATSEVLSEFRYEVDDDHVRAELAGAESGQVVLQETDAWRFDSAGWQQLPSLPVRPLRTAWVNNFVTGPAVARAGVSSGTDTVYNFDVRRIELTYEQFRDAFPQKVADSDYVPDGTSFVYWLDPCDEIVRAEIITTFGPATAALMGPGFPLMISYTYESYDIGADYEAVTPGEPITPIPPPSDS